MLQEYTLKINAQELQVLVGSMHEQPYKIVAGLLNKLQMQINEQEPAQPDIASKRKT